jgi:hypothetical protein
MVDLSDRQKAAAEELREWHEDVAGGLSSRIVLLSVPAGWGRSTVLDCFANRIEAPNGGPVTALFRIGAEAVLEGGGSQASEVRKALADAYTQHPEAKAAGVDRPQGAAVQGMSVAGLFLSGLGLPGGIGMLGAQLAVTVLGNVWDASEAGQMGMLAKAARSAAQLSAKVPVVVLVDDADRLDLRVALVLLENLMFRRDGMMLTVAATDPHSELAKALLKSKHPWMTGRVRAVDVEPEMSEVARMELARKLCPQLDDGLARRIGQRTLTFADVHRVAASDQIAELGEGTDPVIARTVVNTVIGMIMQRPEPSAAAAVVAWAGGVVHSRQLASALAVIGQEEPEADRDLDWPRQHERPVVRVSDAGSPRLRKAVAKLLREQLPEERQQMAAVVLEEALAMGQDPAVPPVERIVAGRAAHRVRGELTEPDGQLADLGRLIRVQRDLVAALEEIGDLAEAAEVTQEALNGCPDGDANVRDRADLAATELRLSLAVPSEDRDEMVRALTEEAVKGGVAVGLEARVWAAVRLLGAPGKREIALELSREVAGDLDRLNLEPTVADWRLLLALHAGRAGYLDITQTLLVPLQSSGRTDFQDGARNVLRAIDGPRTDVRLLILVLEAELEAGPSDDNRIRIYHGLAESYGKLGDFRKARDYAEEELPLRQRLQGHDHPDTLAARYRLATWTGQAGNAARARDLCAELLPDREGVLGAEHPDTLATRVSLAHWTGNAGDRVRELTMYESLLPLCKRALGAGHPTTLAARANHAYCTGTATGYPARARDLFAELPAAYEHALGPEHPLTLAARHNLAYWTGLAGEFATARDMCAELLPVRERVTGPEHPDTLITLESLASFIGFAGDPATARNLWADLLTLREGLLGAEHPDTLRTGGMVAFWTRRAEKQQPLANPTCPKRSRLNES